MEEIIQGCVNNNRVAQAKLYKKLAPKFLGVCLRYGNKQQAEDFLHDGFIKIFKKIKQYNNKGNFEGWAKRVMVNQIIDTIRRESKLDITTEESYHHKLKVETDYQPDIKIEPKSPEILIKMIQQLPRIQQLTFNLYVFDGFTHQEIAEYLNVGYATSKGYLSRARASLQKKIKETNYVG